MHLLLRLPLPPFWRLHLLPTSYLCVHPLPPSLLPSFRPCVRSFIRSVVLLSVRPSLPLSLPPFSSWLSPLCFLVLSLPVFEEVNGCTFRPKTSPRPHDFQVETVVAGATRTQVLYARGLADKERREARAQEVAQVRSNAEVRDCTFRPDTAKSERSRQRANDSAPQVPRGYYETRDRLGERGQCSTHNTHARSLMHVGMRA